MNNKCFKINASTSYHGSYGILDRNMFLCKSLLFRGRGLFTQGCNVCFLLRREKSLSF